MKVALKSGNRDKVHAELTFVAREKEIIILCGDKEVATLTVCTMDKEVVGSKDMIGTENFWLTFNPKVAQCHQASADIILE